MNEFSITPFRGLHLILLLLTAAAVLLIFLPLRGKPEARRSRYLIGVCFFNLALFAGYKLSLSMDAAYIENKFADALRIPSLCHCPQCSGNDRRSLRCV